MASPSPPIVVLTPVRNEAPILPRFLTVTRQIADLIVVADQGSSDESAEICRQYPEVDLVSNPRPEYDEAFRQQLLLRRARELVPGRKILLALDADEIVAANAPSAPGWQRMLAAPPGTVLCFEKPDLYQTPFQCIRFSNTWPLGYVDDGAEHWAQPVHSIRLPTPASAPRLHLDDVKILHYALVSLALQAAKSRLYSVMENLLGTQPVYRRRWAYRPDRDWTAHGRLEPTPLDWLRGWQQLGIDLLSFPTPSCSWHDFEILKLFHQWGARRFWLDPIWTFDWERCRQQALELGLGEIPEEPILPPPAPIQACGWMLDFLYQGWGRLRGWTGQG